MLLETDGIGPAELAERLDIPKSTAHYYLRTLEATGYVVKRDRKYHLGFRFLSVGGRLRNHNRVFQAARSEVRRLAVETGELPNIAVVENDEGGSVISPRSDTGSAVRPPSRV